MMADRPTEQRRQKPAAQNAHVLIWPESSIQPGASGICVGWTIAPLCSLSETPSSYWPVATTIVAGLVPSQPQTLSKDLDAVTRLIQRTSTDCCYCCECSNVVRRASHPHGTIAPGACSGCTRRLCFAELSVVALLSESNQDCSSFQPNLPTITLSSDGIPQLGSHDPSRDNLQIVLYDPSDDTLYRHNEATQNASFFSTVILTRLTHASIVVTTLRNHQLSASSSSSSSIEHDESVQLNKNDAAAAPINSESLSFFGSFDAAFILKNSLFIRHLHSRRRQHGPNRSRWLFPLVDVAHRLYRVIMDQRRAAESPPTTKAACPHCRKLLFFLQSRYEVAATATVESNELALVLIDAFLGLMIGLALFQMFYNQPNWIPMIATFIRTHHQFLTHGLQWLERFPIGFKLNERLTENVGREIQRLWNVHEWTLLRVLGTGDAMVQPAVWVATALSLASGCLGVSGLAALCVDVARLLSLHVSVIALGTHQVYQFELFLLVTLWRLFRGKKRNILRHRTDTMQYDSMQSLFGTILLAIVIFLFSTILVYHVYFTVLHLAIGLVPYSMGMVYSLLHHFPLGSLALRFWRPQWFTQEIFLQEQPCSGSGNSNNNSMSVTRIGVRIIGFWSLVRQFRPLSLEPYTIAGTH